MWRNKKDAQAVRPYSLRKGIYAIMSLLLSYLDSNQDRQNQKLQCYHYTIRQSLKRTFSGWASPVAMVSVNAKLTIVVKSGKSF